LRSSPSYRRTFASTERGFWSDDVPSRFVKCLNVIYLKQDADDPCWDEVIIATIAEHHDVRIYDRMRPASEQLHNIDAIVDPGSVWACRELAAAASDVKLWQTVTVGVDFLDMDTMRRIGVPVCHCPGSTSATGLAEAAMMFMLMIVHRYNSAQETLARGQLYRPMGDEVAGKILGFIGFGESARALARMAKPLGMRFMIARRSEMEPEVLKEFRPDYAGTLADIDHIFSKADFVSLHLPLTPETKEVVTSERIALMKSTACLINIARGELVDQEALYGALLENRIAGIGTDVHADDHPDPTHPVCQHPNFYALPHVAGTTSGTARRRATVVLQNLERIEQGLEPQYRVDHL